MPTKTITIKRSVAASAAEVYRAFTNATGLREWFCDSAQTQVRVGGRVFFGWQDGNALVGKFAKLTPNKKIVMDIRASEASNGEGDTDRSQLTVTLSERNGKTTITLLDCSDGRDWLAISHAIEHGWNDSLDNLKSVLETGIDLRISEKPMLGISFAAQQGKGVTLDSVVAGMAAQQAGLQKGDTILALEDHKTDDFAALDVALKMHKAGDTITVTYLRTGKKHRAPLTLSKRPMPENRPTTAEALAAVVQQLYEHNHKALKAILKGANETQVARAPSAGEWSAKQVLAHLILNERYVHWWLGTLIGSQEAVQDEWEGNISPTIDALVEAQETLKALFNALTVDRRTTVALLRRLPPELVARKGSFTRIATNMLDGWGLHGDEHLEQIKAALG